MKKLNFILLISILFSSLAFAQKSDLTPEAEKLVFAAISEEVYLHAPGNIKDFDYLLVDEEVLSVKGKSFSTLDNKVVSYNCEIALLGRGKIESRYDFEISFCDLDL